ncbi:MAG TPA: class I SAM-dependent methyltransferase [Pseudonocardia sp.]
MDEKTSHPATEHAFVPGLGRTALTPLYDLATRFLGLSGLFTEMTRLAEVRPGQRVLDVGCGTGNLLLTLGRSRPGVELAGLDPDARMLARAERKARRAAVPVTWRRGYAQELPFPDGAFDRVFSSLMLHHLEPDGKAALLAQVRRVLRPDGMLVLADVDGHGAIHGHSPLSRRMARSDLVRDNAGMVERVAAAGFAVEPLTTYRLRLGTITIVRAHN